MSLRNTGFVPNDAQKLAILRGMLFVSTGRDSGRPMLPPSILRSDPSMGLHDDPDEHTLCRQDDGGSWEDDADDDDD